MANNKLQALQQDLAAIYQMIGQGAVTPAMSKLKPLLRKWPQDPDVAHLSALAHKADKQYKIAEQYFSRSLALKSKQPQVHNNFANLYKSLGRYAEAQKHYSAAQSQQANFTDAIRNSALCFFEQADYQQATDGFTKVLKSLPEDVIALIGLADCERETGSLEEAEKLYLKATQLAPHHLNAWYKLGQNHHLHGALVEAIVCYKRAEQIDPQHAQTIQSLGSALHESNSINEAIAILQRGCRIHPANVSLHTRFNEILWETQHSNLFGNSYRQAIRTAPDVVELRIAFIQQLFRAELLEEAAKELASAIAHFSENSELLSLQGQILAEGGNYTQANKSLAGSLDIAFSRDAAQSLVKLAIVQGNYQQATQVLDALFADQADCQLNWAYQSLIWRLTEDPRYGWLNDYDNFVKSYQLETPPGYNSLAEFLKALESVLLSLHKADNAPLQQTLRLGTQTAARLLHRPEHEIQALKSALAAIVTRYINDLPSDHSHPLLRRKLEHFDFSGSWSVKLAANGFHVNHVHPAGWISSSCYIAIPDSMLLNDTNSDSQGCIKFGESPLALGEREVIEKIVKPQAGMVVLFPSYMWHGTVPFSGNDADFRLTSPFDISPAS